MATFTPSSPPAALRHPRGLSTLFFTEMWERLSYYGMRALLVLFLTAKQNDGGYGMTAETAGAIYGLYTALVYLAALPGGWLADRLLGQQRAVLIGGCIIAAGHFSMAIPSEGTFYAGLLLIIIGTGLLKPNVSALVGELYPEGGGRRDAGFSIYYMGINLGAFLGPLVCGYLGQKVNWHLGFSAAGIGMVLGIVQFILGREKLGQAGLPKAPSEARDGAWRQLRRGLGAAMAAIVVLAGLQWTGLIHLTLSSVAHATGAIIVTLAAVYFLVVLIFGRYSKIEKQRIGVIFCLFIGSAFFWSGFEQAGSSMNLFAERLTNRDVLAWTVPASWLQSVNPLLIILLAPLFGMLWLRLGDRQPSIPVKFGAGLLLLGAGFVMLAWGSTYASEASKVSPMWLIVTYVLHTSGELCLSPVGLSSVTKLAPKALVGQMMGVWFMGAALGNLMAGLFGGMFESLPLPRLFGSMSLMALGAGVVFLLLTIPIRKLTAGVR